MLRTILFKYMALIKTGLTDHTAQIMYFIFTVPTTSLTSPNYPSNYDNNYSDTTTMSVSSGTVHVAICAFLTESCCDKVTVRKIHVGEKLINIC